MFKSIKTKLIVFILLLGITPLTVSGVANYFLTSRFLVREAKSKLESMPEPTSRRLEALLYNRWNDIQLFSRLPVFKESEDVARQNAFFKEILSLYAPYSWLGLINLEGKVVSSSDPDTIGANVSHHPWFMRIMETNLIQVDDAHVSELSRNIPVIGFCSPVFDPQGRFKGIIRSEVRMSLVAESIKNISVGHTGSALLLRKDSVVLVDKDGPNPDLSFTAPDLKSYKLASMGKRGTVREMDVYGQDSLISFIPMKGYLTYPGLNWILLVSQSTDEVLAPAKEQVMLTTLIIIVGIVILMIGGVLEARGIVGPVTKIFDTMKEIASGDWSKRVEVDSEDEIGMLADSFNEMFRALLDRESKLRSTLDYLQNLIDSSVDAIITIDVNGNITSCNKAARDLLGYNPGEVVGRDTSIIYGGSKLDIQQVISALTEKGRVESLDTEFLASDGRKIPMDSSFSLLKDKQGEITGLLVISKDLTERKKLEAQLIHQEKMAGIGMMAAGLAHEIGNPLTSISSLVQLMQRKMKEDSHSDRLQLISSHVERISKIVRDMVDFSRPTRYEMKPVEINDTIKKAVGLMRYDRRRRNIQIVLELSSNLPVIVSMEDQVLQVFMNLIINAFDAMENGGTLKIKSWLEEGSIKVAIQDNGNGIREDVLPRIFDPFFTTKEVGKGTGLGLSVSYGIVKSLQGGIEVESKIGVGSTFVVSLPVREREE